MIKNEVKKNNKIFEFNYCNGLNGSNVTQYLKKRSNVVFVSVHGVNHYKSTNEKIVKYADLNTGGMVKTLSMITNASAIINYQRHSSINPYNGVTNADKYVRKFNKNSRNPILFDIHGAKNNNFFDVAIGTSKKPNSKQIVLIKLLKSLAKKYGFKLKLNLYNYKAKSNRTITKRALNIKLKSSIQIELSYDLRNTDKIDSTMKFLINLYKRTNNETKSRY